jgi:uncharacterized protein
MSVILLIVLMPLAFVIGIGASAIGATAWMLLLPILFVVFGFNLYLTILISLLIDCGNALIMTIIASQNQQIDVRMGLKLSLFASIFVVIGVSLGTTFIPDHQDLFKNPSSVGTLLFALAFLRKGYKQGKLEAAMANVEVEVSPGNRVVTLAKGRGLRPLLIYPGLMLVGTQSGLVGIGGGLMYAVLLMFCSAFPTLKATGTAMLITLVTTMVAATGIFFQLPAESSLDRPMVMLTLLLVFISMIGTILGARIAYSLSLKKLNYLIGVVLMSAAFVAFTQSLVFGS